MPALATDKYPPTIKNLFAPRPPLLYAPPVDYPPEKRSTKPVSPISNWKEIYQEHAQRIREENQKADTVVETTLQKQSKARAARERTQAKSFQRQMDEWLDPSLAEKHEKEVMKDPYCTLFIARLDYDVTEVEVAQSFSRFGAIASIRIIRDNHGKSKGYGFVVFERDTDAATCVRELAPTGIKIGPENSAKPPRTALVDIERSRVIRNWKPRRLGGGLGGRGYTKPSQYHLAVASAAASGRRLPQKSRRENSKFPPSYPPAQAPHHGSSMGPSAYGQPAAPAYGLTVAYGLYRSAAPEPSVRDKYAKYGASSTTSYRPTSSLRSVRNIRPGILGVWVRCLGGVWLRPYSFISSSSNHSDSMGDNLHKRPAGEQQSEAKKLKLETTQDASSAKSSTLESSTPSNVSTSSGASKPVLKRKSADETDSKPVSSVATPATPANSVSSANNTNETPTAPNTRLSSPQHVFGATSSFGNSAQSFSKNSVVMGKSTESTPGKHVFGATSSFGKSFEDIKKRPNVFESLPSKLNDKSETPKVTSSFGANSKFGNAFQESLNKKSFLEGASREKSEESESERAEAPQQFKQVELSPVDNKTGEEDERTIFTCTAKLFELDLTKISEGWKERGLGPLHLNQSISSPKQTRLVMRSQGLLRVILNMKISENTILLKGLEASMSPGKFLRVNSVNAEGKPVQHLLKFGSEELRNGLYDEVEKLKEKGKGEKEKEEKQAKEKEEKQGTK